MHWRKRSRPGPAPGPLADHGASAERGYRGLPDLHLQGHRRRPAPERPGLHRTPAAPGNGIPGTRGYPLAAKAPTEWRAFSRTLPGRRHRGRATRHPWLRRGKNQRASVGGCADLRLSAGRTEMAFPRSLGTNEVARRGRACPVPCQNPRVTSECGRGRAPIGAIASPLRTVNAPAWLASPFASPRPCVRWRGCRLTALSDPRWPSSSLDFLGIRPPHLA